MNKSQIKEYRRLRDSGVSVNKRNRIIPHTGEETSIHLTAKSLAALIGIRNGYRVDSEVPVTVHSSEYFIDTLLWGHEKRLTYAVEADHSFTPEKKDRKKAQYVDSTAVEDIQYVDLNEMPAHIVDAFGWIGSELGLDP